MLLACVRPLRAAPRTRDPRRSEGSFADAARFGEVLVNATAGTASLTAAGPDNLAGKILIDVADPIDLSAGLAPNDPTPPILAVCNTDSLGEQIQRTYPEARVVKTFNTVNAGVMVQPGSVPGEHTIFVSGNDSAAKDDVAGLLRSFGWPARDVMDLGDISAARGTEMFFVLWSRVWAATGTASLQYQRCHGLTGSDASFSAFL